MEGSLIKVLVISTTNFGFDGITNVILNYYRALDKTDLKMDLMVPNQINKEFQEEIEAYGGSVYCNPNRFRKPWRYLKTLTEIIRQNRYDIVHAHGNSCTLALELYAAKKTGIKIRIPHSHNTTCKYQLLNRILRKSFDSLYTQAFSCGKKAGEWLYPKKEFEIINNGIELNRYRYDQKLRNEYRTKFNLSDKMVIGHVGNFTDQKNHTYLIDIFLELYNKNKNYRLLLVGDGVLRQEIEKKVNAVQLSEAVIFTGNINFVPQLMQAMDAIVMPSKYEGLPLTLVEAQASCLPCFISDQISSEVAITNLIEFIPIEKPAKEWAHKIERALPHNREKSANYVYHQIADAGYSIQENAKKLKELYASYASA